MDNNSFVKMTIDQPKAVAVGQKEDKHLDSPAVGSNYYIPANVFNLVSMNSMLGNDIAAISSHLNAGGVNYQSIAGKYAEAKDLNSRIKIQLRAQYLENRQAYRRIFDLFDCVNNMPDVSIIIESKDFKELYSSIFRKVSETLPQHKSSAAGAQPAEERAEPGEPNKLPSLPPPPSVPPSSGTDNSTGPGSAGDSSDDGTGGVPPSNDPFAFINWLENQLWAQNGLILGFVEDDYEEDEGGGYQSVKASDLEKQAKKIMGMVNLLSAIISMVMFRFDLVKETLQNLNEVAADQETGLNYRDSLEKLNKSISTILAKMVVNLFQAVNSNNENNYNKRINHYRHRMLDRNHWDAFWDPGKFYNEKYYKKMQKETERYRDITKKLINELKQVLAGIIGDLGKEAANGFDIDKIAYKNMSAAINSIGSYMKEDGHGNLTIDATGLTSECRSTLVAMQNARRMFYDLLFFEADLRATTREEIIGLKSSAPANANLVVSALENENVNLLTFFDMTVSMMNVQMNLHNNIQDIKKDIHKILATRGAKITEFVLEVVAIVVILVVAIILCIFCGESVAAALIAAEIALIATMVVIALTVAALVCEICAADIAHAVDNEYAPCETPPIRHISDNDTHTGNKILDEMNSIEYEMEQMLQQMMHDKGLYSQGKNGFYSFDYHALAEYELRLTGMSNALRAILDLIKNKEDLTRITLSELEGTTYASSSSPMLTSALETDLQQYQLLFQACQFALGEQLTAFNLNWQANKEWAAASFHFNWSMYGMLIGMLLGPIGMSIGLSLGGAIGDYYFDKNSKYNNMDASYSVDGDTTLEEAIRQDGTNSIENRIDQKELEMYEEILQDGIVKSGHGYHAVNFGLMAQMAEQMGQLYMLKEAIASIRSFSEELLQTTRAEITGNAIETDSTLVKDVNRANYSAALSTIQLLSQYLAEKAQIQNMVRDAKEQLELATINLWVSVGTSAVQVASMGCGQYGALINAIGQTLGTILRFVMEYLEEEQAAKSKLGAYQHYDPKDYIFEPNKSKDAKAKGNIDQELEDEAYQIMQQMNSSLIEGSGFFSVSAQSYVLDQRLTRLFNVQEALAMVRSFASESRNLTKKIIGGISASNGVDYLEAVSIKREAAMQTLQHLRQALEVIAQRDTQKADAERQATMTIVYFCINIVQNAIALASAAQATSSQKPIDRCNQELGSEAKPKVQADSNPETLKNPDAEIDKALRLDQPGKNQRLEQIREALIQHQEMSGNIWALSLGAIGIMGQVAKYIYEESYDRREEKQYRTSHLSYSPLDGPKEGGEKAGKGKGKGGGDSHTPKLFASFNAMDAQIFKSQVALQQFLINQKKYEKEEQKSEREMSEIFEMVKSSLSLVESTLTNHFELQRHKEKITALVADKDKPAPERGVQVAWDTNPAVMSDASNPLGQSLGEQNIPTTRGQFMRELMNNPHVQNAIKELNEVSKLKDAAAQLNKVASKSKYANVAGVETNSDQSSVISGFINNAEKVAQPVPVQKPKEKEPEPSEKIERSAYTVTKEEEQGVKTLASSWWANSQARVKLLQFESGGIMEMAFGSSQNSMLVKECDRNRADVQKKLDEFNEKFRSCVRAGLYNEEAFHKAAQGTRAGKLLADEKLEIEGKSVTLDELEGRENQGNRGRITSRTVERARTIEQAKLSQYKQELEKDQTLTPEKRALELSLARSEMDAVITALDERAYINGQKPRIDDGILTSKKTIRDIEDKKRELEKKVSKGKAGSKETERAGSADMENPAVANWASEYFRKASEGNQLVLKTALDASEKEMQERDRKAQQDRTKIQHVNAESGVDQAVEDKLLEDAPNKAATV